MTHTGPSPTIPRSGGHGTAHRRALADRNSRVIFQLPRAANPVMAVRLERVRLPAQWTGWLLLRWDVGHAQWLVDECGAACLLFASVRWLGTCRPSWFGAAVSG